MIKTLHSICSLWALRPRLLCYGALPRCWERSPLSRDDIQQRACDGCAAKEFCRISTRVPQYILGLALRDRSRRRNHESHARENLRRQ
jgi:hypothetical protein